MAATLGFLSGQSAFFVFLGCLFALAMIAHALFFMSQWQAVRNPADKLRIALPVFSILQDDKTTPPKVRGVKLGIAVQNIAPFPIEVEISQLDTQFADKVPIEKFVSRSVVVGASGGGEQFTNSLIDLSKEDLASQTHIGKIKGVIRYGRPGKLKHSAEQSYWVAAKFDKNGQHVGFEVSATELLRQHVA